jgi:hypothetical protein
LNISKVFYETARWWTTCHDKNVLNALGGILFDKLQAWAAV